MIRVWAALALICGWAPAGASQPSVTVTVTGNLVREHFGGPGFQAEMFLDTATPEFFDQVLAKRWRELNPRFARLMLHRERFPDAKPLERLAQQILFLKQAAGTEVYLTGGLRDAPEGEPRKAWAKSVADELDYLLKAGASNVKWHCVTNELSLHGWASLRKDMSTFRAYEQALFDELRARRLPIQVLATDASPIGNWNTIEWAANNMDEITGVYGGHHYINEFAPDDPAFYDTFREKCAWAAGLARAKGKDFIIGEFGPRQYMQVRWGARWDAAEAFGTPAEPMAGLQVAEAVVAAINAGVYAMGYWTFCDYPDDRGASRGVNHWGLFQWMSGDAATRAPYYAYGLMTKFFRGPAAVYRVAVTDAAVRVAAIRNEESGTWSLAVVNRRNESVPVSMVLPEDSRKAFRKYVYDPAHVPSTEDGDLQDPAGKITAKGGRFTDTIAPESLAVYTTMYDDKPPAPVRGLRANAQRDSTTLEWEPGVEKDLCYYRIYQDNVRIGSTTANRFTDAGPRRHRPGDYTVVAVDQSGNAGAPQRVARPAPASGQR
jgi:hypothetical protein